MCCIFEISHSSQAIFFLEILWSKGDHRMALRQRLTWQASQSFSVYYYVNYFLSLISVCCYHLHFYQNHIVCFKLLSRWVLLGRPLFLFLGILTNSPPCHTRSLLYIYSGLFPYTIIYNLVYSLEYSLSLI